jgi:hypothetical protein
MVYEILVLSIVSAGQQNARATAAGCYLMPPKNPDMISWGGDPVLASGLDLGLVAEPSNGVCFAE